MKSKANLMVLKAENQQESSRLDLIKWLIAVTLVVVGIVANFYYSEVAMYLRTLAWLALVGVAAAVAATTQTGKWVVEFFRDSRMELRKVIWPTREETIQTTIVVAVMVVVLALLLWGMDGILVWLIGWLTGQRN